MSYRFFYIAPLRTIAAIENLPKKISPPFNCDQKAIEDFFIRIEEKRENV